MTFILETNIIQYKHVTTPITLPGTIDKRVCLICPVMAGWLPSLQGVYRPHPPPTMGGGLAPPELYTVVISVVQLVITSFVKDLFI